MRIYISAKYKFSYGYGLRRATTETRDRRAVRLLLLEDDPRGDPRGGRLALPEVLRGRRAWVPIFLLQAEPFVVEELEGLLHLLAILQSLDLQVLLPLHRLG